MAFFYNLIRVIIIYNKDERNAEGKVKTTEYIVIDW